MVREESNKTRLTDTDLDFLVEAAAADVADKNGLKQIIREDADFRSTFTADDRVFQRVMADDTVFLRISPSLFFEILLRRAVADLRGVSYTLESAGSMKIPVFDAGEVVELVSRESILVYLAEMLASFTRVENYTVLYRTRKGVWYKIRFNDLDIFSLMRLCEVVEPEYRLGFYKRIADICLFVLGLFPEYVEREYRYPLSGRLRPQLPGRQRISPEQYEEEGRRFYQLAAELPAARELELAEVFSTLHRNFQQVKKPLAFMAAHYLHHRRTLLFG